MVVEFPHHTGRCRSGITQVSFPGCWRCKCTERRVNRGRYPILSSFGGTGGGQTATGPYILVVVLIVRAPADQRSARGIGVCTPCGVVSTVRKSIFVPGVSRLQRCGSNSVPGIGANFLRTWRNSRGGYHSEYVIDKWDWGSHTVRVGVDPEKLHFVSGMRSRRYIGGFLNRVWVPILPVCARTGGRQTEKGPDLQGSTRSTRLNHLAIGPWDWGFYARAVSIREKSSFVSGVLQL